MSAPAILAPDPAWPGFLARMRSLEQQKERRRSRHWHTLERLARQHGWRTGAEVGVCRGWTSFHLLDRLPVLSMILVDQWRQVADPGEPGWDDYGHIDMDRTARMVKERAEGYGGRATVIHAPSVEAARGLADASLDFAFVDAAHTERAVAADICAWAPKIGPAGWLAGHDWDREEVAAALAALLPGWLTAGPDTDKVWIVPRAAIDDRILMELGDAA